MTIPQNLPPIPRQPIGSTFVVALSVLALFLFLQFAAVAVYLLPILREKVVESATVANSPPVTELPKSPSAVPERTPVDPQVAQRIKSLVAESDRLHSVGDLEGALSGITEAASLLPDDPGILLRRARVLENLQQFPEAASAYAEVLALPGLSADLRAQAEKKLSQLGGVPASSPSDEAAPAVSRGADMRDASGLQPGSTLGIVDVRMRDGNPGTKVLRIATKARQDVKVDTSQVKFHVFFYEQDDAGDVQLTESKVVSQWISPPVNWSEDEPELLDITYILPESTLAGSAASNGAPNRNYVGYVLGVYYNGELQDTRADPGPLAKRFPLELYLKPGK